MLQNIATVDVFEVIGVKDYETTFKAFLNEDRDIVDEDRAVKLSLKHRIEDELAEFDVTQSEPEDYSVSIPDEYDRRVMREYMVTVTPLSRGQQ